ncbi:hypothetical protein DHD08_01965 [Arenibacter sp. H213]|nr:hypothetical protein [Arenibacter sp. H213]
MKDFHAIGLFKIVKLQENSPKPNTMYGIVSSYFLLFNSDVIKSTNSLNPILNALVDILIGEPYF